MSDALVPMPCNTDAERAALSCALQWTESIDSISTQKDPSELFYNPAHRTIWNAISVMRNRGSEIDLVTVSTELTKNEQLESVGGTLTLSELLTDVPSPALLPDYLQLLRESQRKRFLISIATEATTKAYKPDSKASEITEMLDAGISEARSDFSKGRLQSYNEVLTGALESVEDAYNSNGELPGISTGFQKLDDRTNGLLPGQLIVTGARPGIGKTSLGFQICLNIARKGIGVGVFSAEMTSAELGVRGISGASGVDSLRMMRGQVVQKEFQKIIQAIKSERNLPIWVDDRSGMRLVDIRTGARRLVRDHGVKVILVDYLQLIKEEDGSRNREDAVRRLSNGLKDLAKELEITVIAIAQLSRSPSGRKDSRPVDSDLRDSGSIEQDANVILLLHNPDPTDESPIVDVELIVSKVRGGKRGVIEMNFEKATTTFSEKTTP